VIKPLSENPGHIQYLCSQLCIGTPGRALFRVFGGFHHKMWRLETDRGTYAVKQLSADTDLGDPDTINHYNVTEAIAETFASRGIAAIFALKSKANYLQVIDNVGYLVHPWSHAVALDVNQISEKHALQVAGVLAKMHRANIVVPGLKEPQFDIHPEEKIIELVRMAGECNIRVAKALDEVLPVILSIVDSQKAAVKILEKHVVISHGDLDQKNVLWDAEGNPVLIDWESARKLNPTFECVLEALDWSGIGSQFDQGLFEKFLSTYIQEGGAIERDSINASFHCILGDWVNWLMYNVGRSIDLEDGEQRLIGAEQVDFALSTILRLKRQIPDLLSITTGWEVHV
jgi:thiamine kinase-like enzyme